MHVPYRPSLSLLFACFTLAGCALDWKPPRDAGDDSDTGASEPGNGMDEPTEDAAEPVLTGEGEDAGRTEAEGEDAGTTETEDGGLDEDATVPSGGECNEQTCGGGTCQEDDSCACEQGYVHDGEQCTLEPPAPAPEPCELISCSADELCNVVSGEAKCECNSGFTRCGERCVDTRKSRENCGKCDYACAGGLACQAGECAQAVHEMVMNADTTCALMEPRAEDGSYALKCWGDDGGFGLFRTGVPHSTLVPEGVQEIPRVRAMALLQDRACVVMPDGLHVKCWGRCGKDCGSDVVGSNDYELLNEFDLPFPATKLSSARGWAQFANVGGNTCALGLGGELQCVGYPIFVTSGMARSLPWPVTVDPPPGTPGFRDVSGDYMHTCAALNDGGRIACWGYLQESWLGAPPPSCQPSQSCYDARIVRKEEGGDLTKAIAVRVSANVSCAVTSEREAYCWGDNADYGLLGCGDVAAHSGAVKVKGVTDIVEVAVGGNVSCVRDGSGQVYCWGSENLLGLGDGAVGDAVEGRYFSAPQAVPGLSDALNVWAGNGYVCARRRSGEVVCWGANTGGNLGNGDKIDQRLPTPVRNLF